MKTQCRGGLTAHSAPILVCGEKKTDYLDCKSRKEQVLSNVFLKKMRKESA